MNTVLATGLAARDPAPGREAWAPGVPHLWAEDVPVATSKGQHGPSSAPAPQWGARVGKGPQWDMAPDSQDTGVFRELQAAKVVWPVQDDRGRCRGHRLPPGAWPRQKEGSC